MKLLAPAGRNVGTKQNTETIFRPAGALKTNNHLFLQTVSPSGATLLLNKYYFQTFLQKFNLLQLFLPLKLHHFEIKISVGETLTKEKKHLIAMQKS